MTDPEGKVTGLEYDTAGRPWRRTLGNGLKEERGWDTRGRLSSFALKSAGGATLRSESWEYSLPSDVLSHSVDGGATAYTYDDEGQLLSESRTSYATSYTYDGNGNRKTRVVNGATETYSYDVGDRLTQIAYGNGDLREYKFDLAGRCEWEKLNTVTQRAYSWTADSRLASLTASTGNESYTYSAFGTRAKVGARTFLRAGAGVTALVLDDGNADYTPGISELRSSTTTYSHSGLKNMGAQSDGSATPAVQATRTYDAFGAATASSGTWQSPFGYAGEYRYEEASSGLEFIGHRYSDPSIGRFLSRDPAQEGSNWYGYCGNDPLAHIDWCGLAKVRITPQHLVHLVKSLADENWDYFFMIGETIIGVEIPDEVKDLIKSVPRPKKMLRNPQGVRGLFQHMLTHVKKVADEPDSSDIPGWRKEIRAAVENIYKKQKQ